MTNDVICEVELWAVIPTKQGEDPRPLCLTLSEVEGIDLAERLGIDAFVNSFSGKDLEDYLSNWLVM